MVTDQVFEVESIVETIDGWRVLFDGGRPSGAMVNHLVESDLSIA